MAVQYVFLALLVLSAQGFTEAKSLRQDERGLVEEVGNLIEQLVDLAHSFIDNSMKVLQELYEQLQGAAKDEFDKAIEQLREISNQVREQLAKIIEQAQGLGQEVKVCIDNEESNIVELSMNTQKEMAECRNQLMNEANKVFNNAIATVVESIGQVTGLWDEFQNCPNVFCSIGVVSKIPQVIAAVKANINTQIANIQMFISTEFGKYQECNAAATANFVLASSEIKGRIETCINSIGN